MRVVPNGQAKQAKNNSSHVFTFKSSITHENMAADLLDAAGEKSIVLVDRYSGYAWCWNAAQFLNIVSTR